MILVALLAAGLIGLLEYASRTLPHADRGRHKTIDSILERSLGKRQAVSGTTVSATASSAVYTPTISTKGSTSTVKTIVVASSAATEDYIPTGPSTAAGGTDIVTASAASGNYIATDTPTTAIENPSKYITPISSTEISSKYIATTSFQNVTILSTQTTSATSFITTADSRGAPTTVQTVLPVETVVSVATSVGFDASHNGRVSTTTWPLWQVFVGNYMAVLIAVIFRIFWTAIYNKIKLIEPFIHLARTEGAVAADTLHAYYLSSSFTPDQVKTFFRGHWLVFWASVVYLVTAAIPSLSTEVIFLDTNYQCANPNLSSPNPCWPPRLSIDPTVARWLQGLLGFIAVMTLGLMLMLARSKTGLPHDPSSIASVAALVHHPQILEDFRSFRDEASIKEIRAELGDKRYKLDDYRRSDGTWRYGIVPVDRSIEYEWSNKQHSGVNVDHKSASKQRIQSDTWWDSAFLVLLLGVLGVLIAYFKVSGDNGFNNFFNSNTFGPRFLMAALATIISMNWKRIEREVHTLTPYHELARSPSPASNTILLRKRSLPYTAISGMLYHKHVFAASLAFTAILADALVIAIAGVPYSPGQIWMELIVCSYVSMSVLGVMIVAIIALLFWRRQSPELPRAPDTILGVISYVADSNLLGDFEGMESVSKQEMDDRINGLGKRYGYGFEVGMDGQKRFMIHEESRLLV